MARSGSRTVPPIDTEPTVYHDSWFDRLFIQLFSHKIARAIHQPHYQPGYDGFVDLSRQIVRGRDATAQREVVGRVLRSLVPAPALWFVRTAFSPTQWVCEWNAWFATKMFVWLVGECEVRSVEVPIDPWQAPAMNPDPSPTSPTSPTQPAPTRSQTSCVYIKKCRYLEASHCVGSCVNVCKLPTQEFFTREFGIPVTMIPNFEDYSCEMIFGQLAPPSEADPALQEPCTTGRCPTADPTASACPRL